MKRGFVAIAIVTLPLILALAVWQTSRYAALAAESRRLEALQEEWLRENEKLDAGIAVLSSRERAASLAKALRLQKAEPAKRLHVDVPRQAKGRSDG